MTIDASTGSKVESCLDAARACGEALAFLQTRSAIVDADLEAALQQAARVASLSADCLQRLPDIREMVLRVCVEICERAALACAAHANVPDIAECGEALAACAAICRDTAEIEMIVALVGTEAAVARPSH